MSASVCRDEPSVKVLAIRAAVSAGLFVAAWLWVFWMWPGLGEGLER